MNRHGLPRSIPEDIKRQIRQRCFFGCVICGIGIYQYEHVDPLYSDAYEHSPKGITLLCPNCHAKVTTGMMSKSKVKEAMQSPFCRKRGYSREIFDIGSGHPIIIFAGSTFINTKIPLVVRNFPLVQIHQDRYNGLFSISGLFFDSLGRNTLRIVENEWQAYSSNWDVVVVGGKIQIREKLRNISLEIITRPPDTLIISKLKMDLQGIMIDGNSERLLLTQISTGQTAQFVNCIASNTDIGFRV